MLGRDKILKLVPHAGRMCLIERVSGWDANEIRCEADSHRDPGNPLRRLGALSAVHIIEYGAQAAAIHASVLATDRQPANRAGVLASVRECDLCVQRLDDLPHALQIHASREAASSEALTYSFEVLHQELRLGRGRLMIKLAPV